MNGRKMTSRNSTGQQLRRSVTLLESKFEQGERTLVVETPVAVEDGAFTRVDDIKQRDAQPNVRQHLPRSKCRKHVSPPRPSSSNSFAVPSVERHCEAFPGALGRTHLVGVPPIDLLPQGHSRLLPKVSRFDPDRVLWGEAERG